MCLPLYCLHRARQCKVGSPEWRRRQVPPEPARLAEYPCESLSLGVVESTPRVPLEYPESTPRVPRKPEKPVKDFGG